MKLLKICSIFLLAVAPAFALITEHTNTVSLTLADVCDGSFNDFKFQISGYDSQVFKFNYNVDLIGMSCTFRLTKPIEGTVYLDVGANDITVNSTSVTFTVAQSNIPPPGSYYGELLSYNTGVANVYRSIAQGKVPITWSLYLNDADYFSQYKTSAMVGYVYVHPSWITPPWITNESLWIMASNKVV